MNPLQAAGVRLTIARKIALAVGAIVILCIGTMAWLTNANLQRGFVAYLNDMQAQDLEQLSGLLAERYQREGGFEWLRHNPRALKDVLDRMAPQLKMEADAPERPRPPPRRAYGGGDDQGGRPRPPPPRGLQDPMAFAARLTVKDEYGLSLVGPDNPPAGISRPIMANGVRVGSVQLLLLRQTSGQSATAASFLRSQTRDILWLAGALLLAAVALAAGLARHLLRPVVAVHGVTARLARGELSARAPVLSHDELGELALHVNGMAQELERNEQQRRQMLADVSHELRTPLTVIRGELEALLDGIRQATPAALESLHAEVLRLTKLVDDLHQLALADTGDLHCDMRELELQSLLLPLLERYRPRAAGAGLSLRWQLAEKPVATLGDAGRLGQVVVNLLENSVRYTDTGGQLVLRLAERDGHAELTLDDSAPGVPPASHARLFARLYRVDKARTRERGGSGLGLAICKALVEAHGGEIVAQPSELGGVRIRVRLPLATRNEGAIEERWKTQHTY
ncbi:ATP-binding protein [Pseudoduganella namucuonensis]|uniref:histidine kinase n=1 Tax=Pseudoduganella namucuonensis TaxID=1035707 RepID=A0A1I7JRG3_9BURK|nr:ATP-binding protein [Pseudoduganella namucuonensis]SFU87747.1 two-component system, OmpR family, sensor histidine kinase BaeS [Pseudoduganella namucuonensis]